MGREIEFDADAICDQCGAVGAYDFMGDLICQECREIEFDYEKAIKEYKENNTTLDCIGKINMVQKIIKRSKDD